MEFCLYLDFVRLEEGGNGVSDSEVAYVPLNSNHKDSFIYYHHRSSLVRSYTFYMALAFFYIPAFRHPSIIKHQKWEVAIEWEFIGGIAVIEFLFKKILYLFR